MRVTLNALTTLKARTGVGHYVAELAAGLEALDGLTLDLFPDGWRREVARRAYALWHRKRPAPANGGGRPSALRRLLGAARPLARQWANAALAADARRACRAHAAELFHEPNHVAWPLDVPTVVTVHDLSVLAHPEFHPADRVRDFERAFLPGLGRAARLIADSAFVRDQMADQLGVAPSRVSVVPCGVREHIRPLSPDELAVGLARLGLAPGYLLYLGTLEPRKNLVTLMRAYCDLPAPLRERHPLVLAGGWGWRAGDIAEFYETHARHRNVRLAGYVADGDLPVWYGGAAALAYPSLYEGFGLPPLEMLACGGRVVVSSGGSLAEVVGRCGEAVDARDVAGWRDALRRALETPPAERERAAALAHAAPYTWERCARLTLGAYRRALGCSTDEHAAREAA